MTMNGVGADDDTVLGPVAGQLSTRQGCTITGPYRFRGSANPLGWGRAVEWGTHSALSHSQLLSNRAAPVTFSQPVETGGCLLPPMPPVPRGLHALQ